MKYNLTAQVINTRQEFLDIIMTLTKNIHIKITMSISENVHIQEHNENKKLNNEQIRTIQNTIQ